MFTDLELVPRETAADTCKQKRQVQARLDTWDMAVWRLTRGHCAVHASNINVEYRDIYRTIRKRATTFSSERASIKA